MKLPEDPFILELLPEFLESWINDMNSTFSELIDTKNDTDLYRLAHTLKGSCFQFGLDDIAKLGVELQTIAKDKDFEKAASYKEPLLQKFNAMLKFLEENVNK